MLEKKIINKSKSWRDLDLILKRLIQNKKEKFAGSIFENLCKFYFQIAPEYKTKISNVYLLKDVPYSIKKKINLPNTDEGIDIIAETFDKEYWAIQCKYRSKKDSTLKIKGDLATFNNLAFTVCKNISHAIVCTTVNRPPQKTKLLNNIGFELLNTWLGLDKNDQELFTQIKSKITGKIVKPLKFEKRKHQNQAIQKTLRYFENNDRGKIIMPCGTGKSLVGFWIAHEMKAKNILIAVPSLALLQQTLRVWTREFLLNNITPDWLCVCSDDTVKEDQDDFVTFSTDLGIKVDTNPKTIKKFLNKKNNKIKILFTTYQSGKATSIGSKGFVFDLGIMDEAHKTVGSKSKIMATLIHQKNIKIKNRLFMTATERIFRGDSDKYLSMNEPKDYGNIIYELSFKEAIETKPPIISDYKILTLRITNSEIEEITKSNKYLEIKKIIKDITARELLTAISLRKAIKKLKIKNAISFHRSIYRANNFKQQQESISKIYPEYGKLKTFHVRGDMPTSQRTLEMLAFEEEKGLMTNARCLTEGVDLPAIDCVCFTDPKRSKIDIVQAAGRALRRSKGKKFGYILIPVFTKGGEDLIDAAKEQGYEDVALTTRALATTDSRIVEYLRSVAEGKKPKGGSPVDGITTIKKLYEVDSEKFNESVQLKIWKKVAIGNYRNVDEFKKIVKSYNFANAKEYFKVYEEGEFPLDFPYNAQQIYNRSWGELLDTGNISSRLRKFDFEVSRDFYRDAIKKNKIKNVKELRDFIKKNNDLFPDNVPKRADNAFKDHPEYYSSGIFFGFSNILKGQYWNFDRARKFVRKLNLKSSVEYKDWCDGKFNKLPEKPLYIPRTPGKVYEKDGWIGWPDFIGFKNTGSFKKKKFSFDEARKFVRKLKLRSKAEFDDYCEGLRKDLPKKPDLLFKTVDLLYQNEGWISWKDFLGYKTKIPRPLKTFLSLDKFISFLKSKNITSEKEYRIYRRKNKSDKLPATPKIIYGNKWKGFSLI